MLNSDGSFDFAGELMALVETFLAEYEREKGSLRNELERGLVMSYVLGTMLCDLDLIWDALGTAPVFGRLNPRVLFEECARTSTGRDALRREIAAELRRKGWVGTPSEDADGPGERSGEEG